MLQLVVREARRLLGLLPVAAEVGMQGDDEVIDGLGLWAALPEDDPRAGKRGSANVSSDLILPNIPYTEM